MKTLNFHNYISEKMKIVPITNNELDKVDEFIYSIKPGDMLREYDIVLVVCECLDKSEEPDIQYGIYRMDRPTLYPIGYIDYLNEVLDFKSIKDEYEFIYLNEYAHYILEVYRSYSQKEKITNAKICKYMKIGEMDKNPNYYCIYKNKELLEKFKLQ